LIEVNLLPGGKKRTARRRRGLSLSLPDVSGLPRDPYILGAVAAGIVSIGLMAWLFLGVRSDMEEAQVQLEAAVQDSVRYADLIQRTSALTARRDSIAARVAIIQDIDAGRYVWPHILDELARALPDYTWMTAITQLQSEPLQIQVTGQAGSIFAITNFMEAIESSEFLRGVSLQRTEQEVQNQGTPDEQIVYGFDLEVTFEPPPLEDLETVPLFESNAGQAAAAAPDTASTR